MIFLSKSFILVGGRSSSIWACWHWKYPVERKEISGGHPSPTRELKRVRWFNISWKGKTAFVRCAFADICSWLNIHQCGIHLRPKRMDEGLRGEEVTRELEKKCLDQPAWDELRCQSSLFYGWVGKSLCEEKMAMNTGILLWKRWLSLWDIPRCLFYQDEFLKPKSGDSSPPASEASKQGWLNAWLRSELCKHNLASVERSQTSVSIFANTFVNTQRWICLSGMFCTRPNLSPLCDICKNIFDFISGNKSFPLSWDVDLRSQKAFPGRELNI